MQTNEKNWIELFVFDHYTWYHFVSLVWQETIFDGDAAVLKFLKYATPTLPLLPSLLTPGVIVFL